MTIEANDTLTDADHMAELEVRRALRGLQRALHGHLSDNEQLEDDDYVSALLNFTQSHLEAAVHRPVSYGLSPVQVLFDD